ncbi:class I SAM-dependent methyltransferase [Aliiglaciecola sp. 3_MG-2023]|uniref:class I SAM-dependent methyltransferase n=1 Tax=Aliiglaciecola sp. 3_MG-2023 TaxID=3062644 RepID=UPI0026E1377C|nr:class I SAM-dependent methyltransferase [Aliiglaciecola sp. 3_MG-2023]MDO6693190.1 class I SAM-dependent methyltransferase [Aliiglaciecola sp. 3_MG-2023]
MLKLLLTEPENPLLQEHALAWQTQWGMEVDNQQSKGLALVLDEHHLALKQLDEPKLGAVFVDFASDVLTFRRQQTSVRKESIAKAVGIKGNVFPRVLDATAGLGRDAFILASFGCHVDMIERSTDVAALLSDGLRRAKTNPLLQDWLPQRMALFHDSAVNLLANWQEIPPDVVYLDPMFPHRKKSALVKKEMRLFQTLLGADEDADDLLGPALELAKQRVVVKRPESAPFLQKKEPNMSIKGKKLRFDVYFTQI